MVWNGNNLQVCKRKKRSFLSWSKLNCGQISRKLQFCWDTGPQLLVFCPPKLRSISFVRSRRRMSRTARGLVGAALNKLSLGSFGPIKKGDIQTPQDAGYCCFFWMMVHLCSILVQFLFFLRFFLRWCHDLLGIAPRFPSDLQPRIGSWAVWVACPPRQTTRATATSSCASAGHTSAEKDPQTMFWNQWRNWQFSIMSQTSSMLYNVCFIMRGHIIPELPLTKPY